MKIINTPIPGVIVFEPATFSDNRGHFLETYQARRYSDAGLPLFVQDNQSHSFKNVLRGLHFQKEHPQGKLVRVVSGAVFDVAIDLRRSSPTFGQWHGEVLSAENSKQMYIPENFAHGFCVLSESAEFLYKCTDYYYPGDEVGMIWDDPTVNVQWPIENPILSDKDAKLPTLQEVMDILPQ